MKKIFFAQILLVTGLLLNSCSKEDSSRVVFKVLDENGTYQILTVKDVENGHAIENPLQGVVWIKNDYSKTKFPVENRYKDTLDLYLPIKYANLVCLDSMAVFNKKVSGANRGTTSVANISPIYGWGLIDKPVSINLNKGVDSDITLYGLLPATTDMKEKGKAAYSRSCFACHGADGTSLRNLTVYEPKFYISLIRKLTQDENNAYLGTYHRNYMPKDFHEVECLATYITTELYKAPK